MRFGARLVSEVAREYLDGRDGYDRKDVLEIARLQVAAETRALMETAGPVICDTDLLVIQVWWAEKYGALPDELIAMLAARQARAYLLMRPDLAWEPDPLRENPGDRDRLFSVYRACLNEGSEPYEVVGGTGEARLQRGIAAAQELLPGIN